MRGYAANSQTGSIQEKWNGINVEIFIDDHCEDHLNRLILSKKTICGKPYKLYIELHSKVDSSYSYVLVNFAEVVYSTGEKITIQDHSRAPLKLYFKQYSNARSISYDFDKKLTQEHKDGQELTVRLSLTLMPNNKTKIFRGTFHGVSTKYRVGLKEQLDG